MFFVTLLLVILLDSVVFGVPVLIYRFAIRNGEPIQSHKKAFLVNMAFFCAGTVALVIFNALCGVYEDPDYRFQLGIVDVSFIGLDYFLLTFKRKSEPSQSWPRCVKCGAPLTDSAKFCIECGEKVAPSGMIVCPKCKNTVTRGKFCPDCGHKFIDPCTPSPAPSTARTPSPALPSNDGSPLTDAHIYVDSLGKITKIMPTPKKEDTADKGSDESVFHYVLIASIATVALTAVFVWIFFVTR